MWEPYFDPTYGASELIELSLNGTRAAIRAPGLVALNGAQGGRAVGVFANGTYALIYLNGTVERLSAQYAGLADGELYALEGGVLRFGDTALKVPWASGASIASGCGYTTAIAWGGGRLAVYLVNGTSAVPLRDLYVPGLEEARGVCAGGYLYVEASSLVNYSESLWAFVAPLMPDKPALRLAVNGSTAHIAWQVPYPQEYNVSSIYLEVYLNGTLIDKKEVPPEGALNYSLEAPGNYTFSVKTQNPFGEAYASANAAYYPRRPAGRQTTATPTTTTQQAPPVRTTTTAETVSQTAGGGGGMGLYSIALGAAVVAAALYILFRPRRGGASRRLAPADAG